MKKLAIFLLLVTLITGNIFAQQHTARELAEQSRQVLENAHALFIDNKFIEAIAEYENAIGLGGLSQYQTQMAQTLLKEAQDVLAKIESFKRPLREDDFEVRQNADVSGGGITITGYKGTESIYTWVDEKSHTIQIGITDVVIPERLYGSPVTSIANGAFLNSGLTSVVILNTVIRIGVQREFGGGAFGDNPLLTQIIIPNSVTLIADNAFINCGLTSVTFGRGVQTIGVNAFTNNKLSSITLPASLRTIEMSAFSNNQLQFLSIPNGVEKIETSAFERNPLTEVVIPASLSRNGSILSNDAFPRTLTRVTLPANMPDWMMRGFEESLANFYTSQNRAAGVYEKNGPVWRRR